MDERLSNTEHEVKELRALLFDHVEGADKRAKDLKVHIKSTIDTALATVVNGKIDKVHQMLERQNERSEIFEKKVDTHIAEVEPFIQAKAGLGVLFKWLLMVAAGVIAWGQIKTGWKL